MDTMSITTHEVQGQRGSAATRAAKALLVAAAVETAVTIMHCVHGARTYDDPGRLHVVVPGLVALALAAGLTWVFLWRPGPLTLIPLFAVTAIPFVGVFGLFHGAYGHALKLILFFSGAP